MEEYETKTFDPALRWVTVNHLRITGPSHTIPLKGRMWHTVCDVCHCTDRMVSTADWNAQRTGCVKGCHRDVPVPEQEPDQFRPKGASPRILLEVEGTSLSVSEWARALSDGDPGLARKKDNAIRQRLHLRSQGTDMADAQVVYGKRRAPGGRVDRKAVAVERADLFSERALASLGPALRRFLRDALDDAYAEARLGIVEGAVAKAMDAAGEYVLAETRRFLQKEAGYAARGRGGEEFPEPGIAEALPPDWTPPA